MSPYWYSTPAGSSQTSPPSLVIDQYASTSVVTLSRTPLSSVQLNHQDELMRDLTPAVKSAYTGLLPNNLTMRANLKAKRDAEGKKASKGKTVSHLGMHEISTPQVLREAVLMGAVSMARKQAKGKGNFHWSLSPAWFASWWKKTGWMWAL